MKSRCYFQHLISLSVLYSSFLTFSRTLFHWFLSFFPVLTNLLHSAGCFTLTFKILKLVPLYKNIKQEARHRPLACHFLQLFGNSSLRSLHFFTIYLVLEMWLVLLRKWFLKYYLTLVNFSFNRNRNKWLVAVILGKQTQKLKCQTPKLKCQSFSWQHN